MPLSHEQKLAILEALNASDDRSAIAERVGVTVAQVAAVAAHRTMGTYNEGVLKRGRKRPVAAPPEPVAHGMVHAAAPTFDRTGGANEILLGPRRYDGTPVFWNPFPPHGAPNPHLLIVGESGSGKTYTVQCLIAELAIRGLPSFVFDYGQGFSRKELPDDFARTARLTEIDASGKGIALNPFQIFRFDHHGPINVAQRLADTFGRIYNIGVQQHAALRSAVVETLASAGITVRNQRSWTRKPPPFRRLLTTLERQAAEKGGASRNHAASIAAHISTVFIFDTFRPSGVSVDWTAALGRKGGVHVFQLRGLETSLERVVTELLLWNFVGYLESIGPADLRCFVVLDEAHRLGFQAGSPTEHLLREGRKFGAGMLLASQQPNDFSDVAFSNTSTKLIFRVADPTGPLLRTLSRLAPTVSRPTPWNLEVPKLARGTCLALGSAEATICNIAGYATRFRQSEQQVDNYADENNK